MTNQQKIVKILLDNEGCLSDGYGWYRINVDKELNRIANHILKQIDTSRPKRIVGPLK